jgi:glycosyltransferase involved in cell wall biosynthesis
MKVFLYSRQDAVGGTERRMLDLHSYLCRQGIKSRIYFSIGKGKQNSKWDNYILVRIIRLWFRLLWYRPNIVHSFDLESGIYATLVTLIYPKPKVVSGFGAEKITDARTQKILAKRWFLADYYICNSEKAAKEIEKRISDLRKIQFVHNGLDAARINTIDTEIENLIPPKNDKVIVGYIGKLDQIKHGERMIEIAKTLYALNPKAYNYQFVVIGGGPYLDNAKTEIESLPISLRESIIITGQIENAGKLIHKFDIGVLCSDSEGLANVILEYMCMGKPWISTDVGDIYTLNQYGTNGLLIQTYDSMHFAKEIQRLKVEKEIANSLGSMGKKVFQMHYSIQKMGDTYIRIYKEIYGK